MASTTRTRHGASARAGKASPAKPKTSARRAPARASRTSAPSSARRAPARAKVAPAKRKTAAVARRIFRGVPILPIALVTGLLALGWFLYPMARLHYAEQRKVQRLQAELASIQQRNTRLKAEVDKLKTPQGVEQAAHELGLARPGEQVWVTVEDGKVTSAPTTASPVRAADAASGAGGWYTPILDAVFGVGP